MKTQQIMQILVLVLSVREGHKPYMGVINLPYGSYLVDRVLKIKH